jgi:hypothetical protein
VQIIELDERTEKNTAHRFTGGAQPSFPKQLRFNEQYEKLVYGYLWSFIIYPWEQTGGPLGYPLWKNNVNLDQEYTMYCLVFFYLGIFW